MHINFQLSQVANNRWRVGAQTLEDASHLAQKITVEGFPCTEVRQRDGSHPFYFDVEGDVERIQPLLENTFADKS